MPFGTGDFVFVRELACDGVGDLRRYPLEPPLPSS